MGTAVLVDGAEVGVVEPQAIGLVSFEPNREVELTIRPYDSSVDVGAGGGKDFSKVIESDASLRKFIA